MKERIDGMGEGESTEPANREPTELDPDLYGPEGQRCVWVQGVQIERPLSQVRSEDLDLIN